MFIIATPLLVVIGIDLAKGQWTGDEITQFAVIFAFGHHLPGMMRAYGDRELFQRFRTRFILAPIVLILVCVAATTSGHPAIFPLALAWGWWHYGMQTYGFMRIYDAKVGSLDRTTQILDRVMCLAWFATPMLLFSGFSNVLPDLLARAQQAGLPLLSSLSVDGVRTGIAAAVTGVTGAFLINAGWRWSRGSGPSPQKLFLMVTTFALYWYSVTTVANIMVAYALFEIFHDIQYLTIVWAFNRGRAKQGANLPAFTRFLFQPRLARIGLYLALIFSYGLFVQTTRAHSSEAMRGVWEGVFLASMLLHYYYDGFIWKLREASTQAPLGLQVAGRGEAVGATGVAGA